MKSKKLIIMKIFNIKRKGQVFTWDLAISIAVFLIVLAMLFYMWDSTVTKSTEIKDIYEMEIIATEVTEQLIRTPGIPRDWEIKENGSYKYNVSNITALGLANVEPRVLNDEKILRFIDLDYREITPLIGTRKYDFYFNMTYINETTDNEEQLFIGGKEISHGAKKSSEAFALTAKRTAILNDTIVRIYFTVWTNRTYAPSIY